MYALSTNLLCVSRHSQFLVLLCIFPELISLQESCRNRFRLSSRLFGCLKCLLILIVRHIREIRNDHRSLVSHCGHTARTLDFANAFLFPGVNSRTELVRPDRCCAVGSGITGNICTCSLYIFKNILCTLK